MQTIVEYSLRIAGGLLLIVPYVWYFCDVWNARFGLGKPLLFHISHVAGLFVLFLTMWAAGAGGFVLSRVCVDVLVYVDLRWRLDLGWHLMSGCAVMFLVPFPLFYWKLHQLRGLMRAMSPRCDNCDYALRGLKIVKREIRCPECGTQNDVRTIVRRFRHEKRVLKASKSDPWRLG